MLVNFVYNPVRDFFHEMQNLDFFQFKYILCRKTNSLAPGFKCLNQYFVVDIDMV